MTNATTEAGPLSGVRTLDLTTDLGAYCGRLFADLGADVIRVEPPDGHSGQWETNANPFSPESAFYNAGKNSVTLDIGTQSGKRILGRLLTTADFILTSDGPSALREVGLEPSALLARYPRLIHVAISAFGLTGPLADAPASDLTLLAAGGLLYLAGDPDRPPVRPPGGQAALIVALHASVGALIALLSRDTTGKGQLVDCSAQESIAHSTENAVQYWDLERIVRRRAGSAPIEAGTGLYRCSDGWVYLFTGLGGKVLGWGALVRWLKEAGASNFDELQDPRWLSATWRQSDQGIRAFRDVFERFARSRSKLDLYESGQLNGVTICPLADLQDVLASPQLKARAFFRNVPTLDGAELQFPGPPYRFATGEVGPRGAPPRIQNWRSSALVADRRHRGRVRSPTPEPLLAGLRVADFTWVGAGPFVTKPLADHGAEVIKVESSTHLDPLREMRPFRDGRPGVNRSGYFANRNSSKRSMLLNLKHGIGRELALKLVAKSDVVVNNFSPGTMERLGLGYAQVSAVCPDIIYVSMPMQGNSGPHRNFHGYGLMISAMTGLYALTGYDDREPVGTGTNYPDHVANPLHAAVAILAALRARRQSGAGQSIELAQTESTLNLLGPSLLTAALRTDNPRRRGNEDARGAPHGVYQCRGDDRWCAIAVFTDEHWAGLRNVLGRPSWAVEARYSTQIGRLACRDELDEHMGRVLRDEDAALLAANLRDAGVPAAAVNDASDLVRDEQLSARQHWVLLDHPEMGGCLYDAPPYRLSESPPPMRTPAPLLGADTKKVALELLGLSESEFEAYSSQGVFV